MNKTTSQLLGVIALSFMTSLVIVGCGSSNSNPEQKDDIYVEALPNNRAEMSVALPDGTLPCGLGQVEWGHQVFRAEDYPACQSAFPSVTVYCLDAQAQWTPDDIEITETTMGTIILEAQREGICGIFPQK
ncbi:MAG: hypothetical protein JXB07_10110 [Anaerolineae bacterium]|nr:hypothetical protein [Anaerolineae bacterium]